MSNRTAFPGTSTTGITHTAAHDNDLPGGWIGYVEKTADQTGITTETDLTGLSQAVTVNTSRRILISCQCMVTKSVASTRAIIRIKEGAVILASGIIGAVTGGNHTVDAQVVLTPSAASHTYKVSLESLDSGSVNLTASSTEKSFLLIEDIGPA